LETGEHGVENYYHLVFTGLKFAFVTRVNYMKIQGGSNMTGTDLCVNKPHCTAAVRP